MLIHKCLKVATGAMSARVPLICFSHKQRMLGNQHSTKKKFTKTSRDMNNPKLCSAGIVENIFAPKAIADVQVVTNMELPA
mmetsp:Transcript_4821/g.30627  ORF Transcript_4821/g.30627 Transcript_4821/m.30627 type:complete len:81 (+) Transcript_4821:2140-2382(+)